MKRSASASPSEFSFSDNDDPAPQTPPTKKAAPAKKFKAPKTPKKGSSDEDTGSPSTPSNKKQRQNAVWTPETRTRFMTGLIDAGYKSRKLEEWAAELGVTAKQVKASIERGRKNNFRDKAVKAVQGTSDS